MRREELEDCDERKEEEKKEFEVRGTSPHDSYEQLMGVWIGVGESLGGCLDV